MKIEDYCQGDAFQAEKRTIFADSWLPVCAEGQVSRPGDFLSVSVGGWGVVAVRDQTGALRVLRNACRHQNMPVVNPGTGNCTSFRCRFHGWTYGLDGKFLSAPPVVAPPATQTERDLVELPTAHQAGMAFFGVNRPAEGPKLDILPAYTGTVVTEIDANWKVVIERLLEDGQEFHRPLLFVRRDGDGAIVRQIVPHTFLRTRLFTHGFGTAAGPVDAIKQACEGLQAKRAAGILPVEGEFHFALKRSMDRSISSPS